MAQAEAPVPLNTGHEDMIHDAQYDYFGRHLATCSSDGTVRVFKLHGAPVSLGTYREHTGPVWCVAWAHPKFGTTLASGSYDGRVVVMQWKGTKFETVYVYQGHKSSVNALSWAPAGHGAAILATCSSDTVISILTYQPTGTWEVATIPNAHQIGCNCIAWEPVTDVPQQRIASGGADNLLKIWVRNAESNAFELEQVVVPTGTKEYQDWIRDVSFCPSAHKDTSTLACCSGPRVYIWKRTQAATASQWTLLSTLDLPDLVWKVSWSEHEALLAATCADGKSYVFKNVNIANPSDWKQISVHCANQP